MITFPSNPNTNDIFTINNSTYVFDGNSWVSQNGIVLAPGQGSALNVFMTNPTTALTADNAGVVASYAGTENNIYVFQGNTELVYDGSGLTSGKFKVLPTTETNITFGGVGGVSNHAYLSSVSAFNSATETAYIDYTVSGKDLNNVAFSTVVRHTFSKAKQGAQGPAGSGGGGSTEDITLFKYGEHIFNDVTVVKGKGLTVIPTFYDNQLYELSYSPGTTQIRRTNTCNYIELSGLNKLVGFRHLNTYRVDLNAEIGTTFALIPGHANDTFFTGFTYDMWGNTGGWLSSIASVQAQQIGIGYNETGANWKLVIPRDAFPNILVDLGVPKPANNDMYKVVFKFDYAALTLNIQLTNLDTNTIIINETINLTDDPGLINAGTKTGYQPYYARMYYNCFLSSGSVTSNAPMLALSRTYYKYKENKQ